MSKIEKGQTVSLHYVGTLDDGTEFDSSRTRGEAASFEIGAGKLIKGFEEAVQEMEVGETKTVHLTAEQAYGDPHPQLIQKVPRNLFPEDFEFEVGGLIQARDQSGNVMVARLESLNEGEAVLDYNHPMAGKNLNFEIELLEIE
mgnify:CR=1 FL=1